MYFDSGINASAVPGMTPALDAVQYEADAQAVFRRAVAAIQARGKWASSWSQGSEPFLTRETCHAVVRQWIVSGADRDSTFQVATTAFSNIFRHPKPYKGEAAIWPHSPRDQNATVAAFLLARPLDAVLELRPPHGAYWFATDLAVDAPILQIDLGAALGPAREFANDSSSVWTREYERGTVSLDCAAWQSRFILREPRKH